MRAVIMAGGEGTRLRPLTCDRPKPMVPIANRPMMEHIVELLARHGLTEIYVTACYLPEVIEAHFGDGARHGVCMRHLTEETPLGTAGSVKNAESFLNETFLVISGDALTDIDLGAAIHFHRRRGAAATLVLKRVENPLDYGVVITRPDGRIRQFLEKPSWGQVFSDTVNTGIYVLEPAVLARCPAGRSVDFSRDLFPELLRAGEPLFGYVADGYWSDIGNLDEYRRAHIDALDGRVRVRIAGEAERPGVWIGPGAEVSPRAQIEGPVIIGAGAHVDAGAVLAPYSVVGPESWIGEGASLKRSILWEHAYVENRAELRGAIIGRGARIRAGAAVYEGAVIGDDSHVGEGARIKPNVRVWPEKTVEAGATMTQSLVWGSRCARTLFGACGVSGLANLEVTPEMAARLGAAFGGWHAAGRVVAASSDGSIGARMLKRAFVSGVMSAGVSVGDLGSLPVPVVRFGVALLELAGGVHVRRAAPDDRSVVIELFDGRGINLARSDERKVETLYFREDFRRADPARIGDVRFAPPILERYLDVVAGSVDAPLIRQAAPRVVAVATPVVGQVLIPLLERLGCQVFGLGRIGRESAGREGTRADGSPAGSEPAVAAAAAAVEGLGADLGVVAYDCGERFRLIDDTGQPLSEGRVWTLLALCALEAGGVERLAVPVTAPGAVEALAISQKRPVVRTQADRRDVMEAAAEGGHHGPPGFPQLQPAVDVCLALGRVLELAARRRAAHRPGQFADDARLSQILAALPAGVEGQRMVPCAWEAKGRVMRTLIEEADPERVELIDGVKVYHDGGWALVLPDSERPVMHLRSEAATGEEADALLHQYAARIEQIQAP